MQTLDIRPPTAHTVVMTLTMTDTCQGCWDETCADCNPQGATQANGWKGMPSTTHGNGSALVNPASEAQVNYLRSLVARTGETMPALPISRTEASRLIDRLASMPNKPGLTAASPKQADFIRSLWAAKGLPGDVEAAIAALMTRAAASALIDSLKACETQVTTCPAEAKAEGLEDGIYLLDGQYRKVYRTQSGHQVAKVWDGAEWEYVGKAGLKGLTAEHKLTLEQAKRFGHIYGVCCVCSRTLTDEESIAAGIGPVCAAKF